MGALEAIMTIVGDLFKLNGIPDGTTGMIVNVLTGFFGGIWTFIEFIGKIFEMFQGVTPVA